MRFVYADGTVYQNSPEQDPMHRAFLKNLCLRPSCHECVFCVRDREADITLADFWGIENVLPGFDDGKGVSFMVVHSETGNQILNELLERKRIACTEVDFEKSIVGNPSMISPIIKPLRRERFMRKIARTKDFEKTVAKFTRKRSALRMYLGKLRAKVYRMKRRGKA